MKIKIVDPDGNINEFEANFWEFSQNKFTDEDVVLVFYKYEVPDTQKKVESKEEDKPSNIPTRPSKSGVLLKDSDNLIKPLKEILGSEAIENFRTKKDIVFVPNNKSFTTNTFATITTDAFDMTQEALVKATEELIDKETELLRIYQLQIAKEARIISKGSKFVIEEELRVGKET